MYIYFVLIYKYNDEILQLFLLYPCQIFPDSTQEDCSTDNPTEGSTGSTDNPPSEKTHKQRNRLLILVESIEIRLYLQFVNCS